MEISPSHLWDPQRRCTFHTGPVHEWCVNQIEVKSVDLVADRSIDETIWKRLQNAIRPQTHPSPLDHWCFYECPFPATNELGRVESGRVDVQEE